MSDYDDEIAYKLIQAFAVWREKGGPDSILVDDAVRILSKNYPTITKSKLETIVTISPILEITAGKITLSKKAKDLLR